MRKIQKAARDLKPGDVLLYCKGPHGEAATLRRFAVVSTAPSATACSYAIWQIELGREDATMNGFTRSGEVKFDVEAPDDLTPAQQHADELAALVRRARLGGGRQWDADADALLDKIKPPEPPGLAAALEALRAGGWDDDELATAKARLLEARKGGR